MFYKKSKNAIINWISFEIHEFELKGWRNKWLK